VLFRSHDELVALGGRYAQMYETWMTHTGAAMLDDA